MPRKAEFRLSTMLLIACALVFPAGAAVAQGTMADPAVTGAFDVHSYLVYYHGGTGGESRPIPLVDRAGNVILCGNTGSVDFPQLPPGRAFLASDLSVFVAKRDREGGTLLYSQRFGSRLSLIDAAIGANDAVVLLVDTYNSLSFDSLLTADAADSLRSRYGLLILDCQGDIAYASYIPTSGLGSIQSLGIGPDGRIWLLASTTGIPPFTTPDALFPVKPGGMDAYLLRFSPDGKQLEYATFFGGPGNDYITDMAVGSAGIALFGYSSGKNGFPVVNAIQDSLSGSSDLILARLSPDGKTLHFSSYLGGSGHESFNKPYAAGSMLDIDSTGAMYVAGYSASSDFPWTDSVRLAPVVYGNWVLCVIDGSGALAFSTRLGSTSEFGITDLVADGCGNVILAGRAQGQNIALVDPLMMAGGSYLAVIDTRTDALRFSTRIKGPQSDQSLLCLDGHALFLAGVADTSGMPASTGFPGPHPVRYNVDPFIAGFAMPSLCGRPAIGDSSMRRLAVELLAPDTLLIDIPRQLVKPAEFPLEVRIRNLSDQAASGALDLRVRVDGGILLEGAGVLEERKLPALPAGGETAEHWTVLTDFDRIHPKTSVYVLGSMRTDDPCPMGASAVKAITVLYTDFTYADMRCEVVQVAPFALDDRRTKLSPDTATLHVRVINRSANDAPLRVLRLKLPAGSGVTPSAPAAMERVIPPIMPGDTTELSWTLRAETRQFDRVVRAEVALVDTFGYEMRHGGTDLFIPGAPGSRCHLLAPSSLVLHGDGITEFDTLLLRLNVENESDTIRFYSGLRLDLSGAPYLRAADEDSLERGSFYVRERFRRVFDWLLVAAPGLGNEALQTIRTAYMTDSDNGDHACEAVVRLIPRRRQLACSWIAADSLRPGSEPALGDTITVAAVFANIGDVPQELGHAWLRPPDSVGVMDPLRRPLASLAPGEADTVTWNVFVFRSAVQRDLDFEVLALRPDDSEVTRCTWRLSVAPVEGRYTYGCESAGHDSLWRDPFYGRLIPNPLQLQYTVINTGTVVMPVCDLAIVLPPALRVSAGEDSTRRIPVLQPAEGWSAEWMLDVVEEHAGDGPLEVHWEVRSEDSLLAVSCVHHIGIADHAPAGIVLSPWLLRFEGHRDDDPPSSREIQFWTGGGTDPLWTISQPSWLDMQPAAGRGHVRAFAGPNTTLLLPGVHSDSITLHPGPLRPGSPRILYRIDGLVSVEERRALPQGVEIRSLYPNPVVAGGHVRADISTSIDAPFSASIHDLLGRERLRLQGTAVDAQGHIHLRFGTAGLEPGLYLLSIRSGAARATRAYVVTE